MNKLLIPIGTIIALAISFGVLQSQSSTNEKNIEKNEEKIEKMDEKIDQRTMENQEYLMRQIELDTKQNMMIENLNKAIDKIEKGR